MTYNKQMMTEIFNQLSYDIDHNREVIDQIAPDDVILREAWGVALKVAARWYKPEDFAGRAKNEEARDRHVISSAKWDRWSEFFARSAKRKADMVLDGSMIEHKSGAGDWIPVRCGDYDKAIAEAKASRKKYWFHVREYGINIILPLGELLELLACYNGSVNTWMKPKVAKTTEGYKLQLQTYDTSKKKLRYLQTLTNTNLGDDLQDWEA